MITLHDYYMGRDKSHASELGPELEQNAITLVERINKFLEIAAKHGIYPSVDAVTKNPVGSGWRPLGVNAETSNSAKNSLHMTCEACDIRDIGKRPLATWACSLDGREALQAIGLWC